MIALQNLLTYCQTSVQSNLVTGRIAGLSDLAGQHMYNRRMRLALMCGYDEIWLTDALRTSLPFRP